MKILFNKYEGTGNDFIIINNVAGIIKHNDHKLISRLCDRRFGIGADGLILIEECKGYDFKMVFFNSDGYPATMCGNGGRCASHFVMTHMTGFQPVRFLAADGAHSAIPAGELIDLTINDVNEIRTTQDGILINTGVPHLVVFVSETENADLVSIARPLRYSASYAPSGVNVNLVQTEGNTLTVRTYERGVEGETLSCGTGVTASAIAAVKTGKIVITEAEAEVKVKVKGGDLAVSFTMKDDKATNIHLTGPATFVFSGEIELQ